jgi:transcriptional regulator with XRE-family HTH domain
MIDIVKVGEKIASLRIKKGYSQDLLAGKLYVSRQAISAWEIGKSAPSIDNIIELSKIFKVPFEEVLCLDDIEEIDAVNIFSGHDRSYVIRGIIEGRLHLDVGEVLYQCTGSERMQVLKAIKEGRLQYPMRDLRPRLTDEEKKYLVKGELR